MEIWILGKNDVNGSNSALAFRNDLIASRNGSAEFPVAELENNSCINKDILIDWKMQIAKFSITTEKQLTPEFICLIQRIR